MTDLLDAVDDLTQPTKTRVIQTNDAGITCTSDAETPSLLDQLEASIQSSMGGSTSGSSLAFEGAPLNTAALFEAMKIATQIGDWCRIVGAPVTKHLSEDLRAWYAATLSKVNWDDTSYTRNLRRWAGTIRSLLDPPREKYLPDPCPNCGEKDFWKGGELFMFPLVVKYRTEDPIGSATALCRACEKVWNARELAYELEQRHGGETLAKEA